MDNFYYYSAIRSVSLAISDVFTGIKVAKTDQEGKILGMVDVPLKYGLKQKDFYWRNDNKYNPQYPMMGLSSTQMQYATDRATQKLAKIYIDKQMVIQDKLWDKLKVMLNPSPWNITYNLQIATMFVIEAEQILEQILPYFNPFIMLSVPILDLNFAYDCKVILGSVSETKQDTLSEDETRIIMWNLDFTCHAYLFKPIEEIGKVKQIITNYIDPPEKETIVIE